MLLTLKDGTVGIHLAEVDVRMSLSISRSKVVSLFGQVNGISRMSFSLSLDKYAHIF